MTPRSCASTPRSCASAPSATRRIDTPRGDGGRGAHRPGPLSPRRNTKKTRLSAVPIDALPGDGGTADAPSSSRRIRYSFVEMQVLEPKLPLDSICTIYSPRLPLHVIVTCSGVPNPSLFGDRRRRREAKNPSSHPHVPSTRRERQAASVHGADAGRPRYQRGDIALAPSPLGRSIVRDAGTRSRILAFCACATEDAGVPSSSRRIRSRYSFVDMQVLDAQVIVTRSVVLTLFSSATVGDRRRRHEAKKPPSHPYDPPTR
ncbi:hypothetical protein DFH06DRAFT_112501 [Mycena polygramma]|nr:hypothetical protein DFH06DRAFT_112501 [Mycena polygramma]